MEPGLTPSLGVLEASKVLSGCVGVVSQGQGTMHPELPICKHDSQIPG
jgi:hypothetical protein